MELVSSEFEEARPVHLRRVACRFHLTLLCALPYFEQRDGGENKVGEL